MTEPSYEITTSAVSKAILLGNPKRPEWGSPGTGLAIQLISYVSNEIYFLNHGKFTLY